MRKLVMCTVLATAPMCAANSADRGFYFGADLGQSSVDADQSELDASLIDAFSSAGLTVLDGSSDLSDESFVYGFTVGYRLLPYLAVEAAYLDLGTAEYKARASVTDGVSVADGRLDLDASATGFTASVLGILPFTDTWSVYARAGVVYAHVKNSMGVASGDVSDSASDSDNETEALFGAGIGYTSGSWTTRLDFQRFMDLGEKEGLGETDVDRITIGAIYQF